MERAYERFMRSVRPAFKASDRYIERQTTKDSSSNQCACIRQVLFRIASERRTEDEIVRRLGSDRFRGLIR